ncbi:hypothetical protein V8B97DRAFT_1022532 [Scleroderma yunnanense]
MLRVLELLRKLLLSAVKRYSPVHLLQYLFAVCRAVFRRCKSKCYDQDSRHELPSLKIPTIGEEKGSLSESTPTTIVRHVVSGSLAPALSQGPSYGSAIELMEGAHPQTTNEVSPCKYRCNPPLRKGRKYMWDKLPTLVNMVFLFDHPGFIQRSLAHTQIKDGSRGFFTDVEKWREFSRTYGKDIGSVNLLVSGDITRQYKRVTKISLTREPCS